MKTLKAAFIVLLAISTAISPAYPAEYTQKSTTVIPVSNPDSKANAAAEVAKSQAIQDANTQYQQPTAPSKPVLNETVYNPDQTFSKLTYELSPDQATRRIVFKENYAADGTVTGSEKYQYDSTGQHVTKDSFSANGTQTSQTLYIYEGESIRTAVVYDYANGKPTGAYAVFTYDPVLQDVIEEDHAANGAITGSEHYSFDAAGRLESKDSRSASGVQTGHTTYFYTGDTLETSIRYDYDAAGNQTGAYAIFTHNLSGQIVREEDHAANGTVTGSEKYTYDTAGNLKIKDTYSSTGIQMYQTTYVYDLVNYGESGHLSASVYLYDENGIRTKIYENYLYNSIGQLVQKYESAYGITTELEKYKYDPAGRLIVKDSFSSNGVQTVQTAQTTYAYDLNGILTSAKQYAYNASGQQTGAFDRFTYNPIGQIVEKRSFNAQKALIGYEQYFYNTTGPFVGELYLTRSFSANGIKLGSERYYYNAAGQLETKDIFNANGIRTGSEEYTYNERGSISVCRVATWASGFSTGTTVFTYNAIGQLIRKDMINQVNVLAGYEIYSYNLNGQILRKEMFSWDSMLTRHVLTGYETYSYVSGWLSKKTIFGQSSGIQSNVILLSYENYSYITSGPNYGKLGFKYVSGATGVISGEQYTYNSIGQLIGTYFTGARNAPVRSEQYTYSSIGQLIGKSIRSPNNAPMGSERYTYDPAGRLVFKEILDNYSWLAPVRSERYIYNSIGQLERVDITARNSALSSERYIYNGSGQITTKTTFTGGVMTSSQVYNYAKGLLNTYDMYSYTGGRLITKTTYTAKANILRHETYNYDAISGLLTTVDIFDNDNPATRKRVGYREYLYTNGAQAGYNEYSLDGNGRIVVKNIFNSSNTRTGYELYKYDAASGLFTKADIFNNAGTKTGYREYVYDADGVLTGYVNNIYDAKGNIGTKQHLDKSNLVVSYETFTYTTSRKPLQITYFVKDYTPGSRSGGVDRMIGYDTFTYAGEVLSAKRVYNALGQNTKLENYVGGLYDNSIEYTYNTSGQKETVKYKNSSYAVTSYEIYTYADYKVTKKDIYNSDQADKVLKSSQVYTYSYGVLSGSTIEEYDTVSGKVTKKQYLTSANALRYYETFKYGASSLEKTTWNPGDVPSRIDFYSVSENGNAVLNSYETYICYTVGGKPQIQERNVYANPSNPMHYQRQVYSYVEGKLSAKTLYDVVVKSLGTPATLDHLATPPVLVQTLWGYVNYTYNSDGSYQITTKHKFTTTFDSRTLQRTELIETYGPDGRLTGKVYEPYDTYRGNPMIKSTYTYSYPADGSAPREILVEQLVPKFYVQGNPQYPMVGYTKLTYDPVTGLQTGQEYFTGAFD